MSYTTIYNFLGVNKLLDPRRLKPNKDDEGVAEAAEIENMDITYQGSMATSTGYEKVSEIAGTGPVLNLLNYEKDDDERWLIISHGDKHYSITPSNSAWATTNLGDYGDIATYVDGTVFKGTSSVRRAILLNDVAANEPKAADLAGAMTDATSAENGSTLGAVFMGRLFTAKGSTLYYSDVEDETSQDGSISFNDIITGLIVSGERMIVLTKTYHQGIKFTYDDTWNLSTPLKEAYEKPYGCLSPKSVRGMGSNIYYFSPRGVIKLGAEANYIDQTTPRPQPISEAIEPLLENINKAYRKGIVSEYWDKRRQYFLTVPYNSTYNNTTFVWNEDWESWTIRTGFYPSAWANFRNDNYEEELYFGSHFGPTLYKLNDKYSYDGNGYYRRWKSKTFTHGAPNSVKTWGWIDIAGSMDASTQFDVVITVDNTRKRFRIDSTHLLLTSFGDYIGDNWRGDIYLGGESPAESRFKRYFARIEFPKDIREGMEMTIELENSAAEQPFKVDFIGIQYDIKYPLTVTPNKFRNNNQRPI